MKRPENKDIRSMSAVEYHEYQRVIGWMEQQIALREAISRDAARPIVARAIGIAPGTIENIIKGRLKGLKGSVERAIDAALVRFLDRQRRCIEHELELAAARLGRGDRGVVGKAEAARDALVSLIEEAGR